MGKKDGKGALLYLAIVALTAAAFAATMNAKTAEALAGIDPLGFAPLAIAWMAGILLDAGALSLFLRSGGTRISYRAAIENTFIRLFFNVVTPSSFGGQPFAIAALGKAGVPYGSGSAAVFSKTAVYSIVNFLSAFIAIALFPSLLRASPALGPAFMASGALGAGGIALFLLAFFIPALLEPAVKPAVRIFARLARLFGKRIDAGAAIEKVLAECALARASFRAYFRERPLTALAACLLTAATHAANLSELWFAAAALGGGLPYGEGLVLGSVLFFLISFLPSPGAAGLGEALYAALFAGRIPLHLLGLSILAWRLFNQYLNAIIGSLLSARAFSKRRAGPGRLAEPGLGSLD